MNALTFLFRTELWWDGQQQCSCALAFSSLNKNVRAFTMNTLTFVPNKTPVGLPQAMPIKPELRGGALSRLNTNGCSP